MYKIFESISIVVGLVATFIIGVFGFALILALPTMWLWDWLMPQLFGLTEITVWQALGINFLSSILFKSSSTTKK